MVRVMYVGVAPFSYGELGLLLNVARRLPGGGRDAVFLVSEAHRPWVEHEGWPVLPVVIGSAARNRALVESALVSQRIDVVVVPDFLSLWYTDPFYGLDSSFWRKLSVPILSLDSHGWPRLGYTMDVAGVQFDPTGLGGEPVSPAAMPFAEILPVCPLHPIEGDGSRAIAMYPLRHRTGTGAAVRDRLGCRAGEKLVFLVGLIDAAKSLSQAAEIAKLRFESTQAKPSALKMFAAMAKLGASGAMSTLAGLSAPVSALLSHYFERLDTPLRVVTAAHMLSTEMAVADAPGGRVRWLQLPMLAEAEYDALIEAADLVVSLNEISGTLAKAVLAGVPAVALINSLGSRDELSHKLEGAGLPPSVASALTALPTLYPWRYFPVGMYRYYAPLLAGSEYGQTYLAQEIFDGRECVALIDRALHDTELIAQLRSRQGEYVHRLGGLAEPAVVLEQVKDRLFH